MTYVARSCPCCGSTGHEAYPALVAPFIASYVLGTRPLPTRLLECKDCGFRFFEDRFTDAEAERLYAGYRGDRYFHERHRHEPWYTRKVNDVIGQDDEVVRRRRELVQGFLRAHGDLSTCDEVLDYGGDRGQLIPPVGKRRFVYEISSATPVDGVTRIGSAAELCGRKFDLVLLSHVLEHCSEPGNVLDEVRLLLRGSASLLYVELPFERASLRLLGRRGAYRAYLAALRRAGPLLTAVDLYSTLARMRLKALPPLGFVKLHEHINFFSEGSLARLLETHGFEAVALSRLEVRTKIGATPVISALARLR